MLNKNFLRRGCLVIAGILFLIFLMQYNKIEKTELLSTEGRTFEKAVVTEVISDNLTENGNRVGNQTVRLRLCSGKFKNEKEEAISSSSYLFGATCKKGMKVIALVSESQGEVIASVMGLGFTIVCVLFLFLPMIYRGVSPIFSAVVVAVITTVVTIYLISGISVKSLTAISGTVTGVVMAVIFAGIFGKVTQITGYNVSDIEELIYLEEKTAIKINELLFAGILIASLGAVMDVGMSIASTLQEIYSRRPDLGMWDLFKSGMNVGKDMMGTMSNTLILAFAGGSLNTLVFIFAYNYSYHQIINMYSIGIELMQGISASMGVILTVPFTSLAGAFFISGKVLKK